MSKIKASTLLKVFTVNCGRGKCVTVPASISKQLPETLLGLVCEAEINDDGTGRITYEFVSAPNRGGSTA